MEEANNHSRYYRLERLNFEGILHRQAWVHSYLEESRDIVAVSLKIFEMLTMLIQEAYCLYKSAVVRDMYHILLQETNAAMHQRILAAVDSENLLA